MTRYLNIGGRSGVKAYEILENGIIIRFSDGSEYLYTNSSAGALRITEMKNLAHRGSGLNRYVNLKVRKKYERKLR